MPTHRATQRTCRGVNASRRRGSCDLTLSLSPTITQQHTHIILIFTSHTTPHILATRRNIHAYTHHASYATHTIPHHTSRWRLRACTLFSRQTHSNTLSTYLTLQLRQYTPTYSATLSTCSHSHTYTCAGTQRPWHASHHAHRGVNSSDIRITQDTLAHIHTIHFAHTS